MRLSHIKASMTTSCCKSSSLVANMGKSFHPCARHGFDCCSSHFVIISPLQSVRCLSLYLFLLLFLSLSLYVFMCHLCWNGIFELFLHWYCNDNEWIGQFTPSNGVPNSQLNILLDSPLPWRKNARAKFLLLNTKVAHKPIHTSILLE